MPLHGVVIDASRSPGEPTSIAARKLYQTQGGGVLSVRRAITEMSRDRNLSGRAYRAYFPSWVTRPEVSLTLMGTAETPTVTTATR